MLQISQSRTVKVLLDELLGTNGCSFRVGDSANYVAKGEKISFLGLAKRAQSRNEVLCGYQKKLSVETTMLNPVDKDVIRQWDDYDVVVLCGSMLRSDVSTTGHSSSDTNFGMPINRRATFNMRETPIGSKSIHDIVNERRKHEEAHDEDDDDDEDNNDDDGEEDIATNAASASCADEGKDPGETQNINLSAPKSGDVTESLAQLSSLVAKLGTADAQKHFVAGLADDDASLLTEKLAWLNTRVKATPQATLPPLVPQSRHFPAKRER